MSLSAGETGTDGTNGDVLSTLVGLQTVSSCVVGAPDLAVGFR